MTCAVQNGSRVRRVGPESRDLAVCEIEDGASISGIIAANDLFIGAVLALVYCSAGQARGRSTLHGDDVKCAVTNLPILLNWFEKKLHSIVERLYFLRNVSLFSSSLLSSISALLPFK